MALPVLKRQLRLLSLLAANYSMDIDQIAERMQMGRRQIYRYIEALRQAGFEFSHTGSIYRLNPSSPFYRELRRSFAMRPTDDVFHTEIYIKRIEDNLQNIYHAIDQHRQVVLHNYHSQNSQRTSDRLVEPFYLFESTDDVRCYEVESGMNKTFRIARAEKVEVLPTPWQNESAHIFPITDLFGYSSDKKEDVTLRLTPRAYQFLREEYGVDETQVEVEKRAKDGSVETYLMHTYYCHPFGIGRYVMGLPADIEVLKNPALRKYIVDQTKKIIKK